MPRQLSFDLPVRPATGRGDFFVSPANAEAVAMLDAWATWPAGKLVLIGPEGAGKSHLARVWAAEAGAALLQPGETAAAGPGRAVVVEDADRVAGEAAAEEWLFHLHNNVLAHGGRLLLTARSAPSHWGIGLPDLASRMLATPQAQIAPPDDALLAALFVKAFADRQLAPPEALIPYLVTRTDRSFAAVQSLVAELDALALARGAPVGMRLAAEVLDKSAKRGG
jgi:chromosomal replication initiation ATPase DnaA